MKMASEKALVAKFAYTIDPDHVVKVATCLVSDEPGCTRLVRMYVWVYY